MRSFFTLALLLCLSCGYSSPATFDAPAALDAPVADGPRPDATTGPLADGGPIPHVPDPGNFPMPMSWPDTEPNDTPDQAVPVGVRSGQIGPYVELFGQGGHLGGGDEADYFVFRTGPDPGSTFIANACWNPDLHVNLLDFVLYKVIDGQPLIVVDSSNRTDAACELPQPFWSLPLETDTKYLFAMIHVEGEGLYQA